MIPTPGIVWDACCLLNLAATGRVAEILAALECPCYVEKEVHERETLYLRALPEEDPRRPLIALDLRPYLDAGVLIETTLTSEEKALFIQFAAEADDGEARSLALAYQRGWTLATDDRLPLRIARGLHPPLPTLTTPEWMRCWAERSAQEPNTVQDALRRIQLGASYVPPRARPLQSWWESCL